MTTLRRRSCPCIAFCSEHLPVASSAVTAEVYAPSKCVSLFLYLSVTDVIPIPLRALMHSLDRLNAVRLDQESQTLTTVFSVFVSDFLNPDERCGVLLRVIIERCVLSPQFCLAI